MRLPLRRLGRGLAAASIITALATGALPAPAEAAALPGYGKITVGGKTYITDAQGRALTLRGFNRGKYANDHVTLPDIQRMSARGFNFLRLVVQWDNIEPVKGRYNQRYLGYVDRVLNWADRYGIYVMVDMHQDVFGPAFDSPGTNSHDGAPKWATRTDGLPFVHNPDDWFQDYFQPAVMRAFEHLYEDADLRAAQVKMWQVLVKKIRHHRSLLGYDLFNEPFGEMQSQDLVTEAARIEKTRISPMYRRLIKAIREHDRRSWLFVEPTALVGHGVPTQLQSFRDPRVGYAPHFYDDSVEVGKDWKPNGFIQKYEAAISLYPKANRMPMIVGEWGPPSARTQGNALLVRRQVAAMNRFASGWAQWYWCAGNGGYCALDPRNNPARGNEPAFSPYAPRIVGDPVEQFFNPDSRRYRLTFKLRRGVSGQTLVTVPVATYPRGAKPQINGGGARVTFRYDARAHVLRVIAAGRPGTTVKVSLIPR